MNASLYAQACGTEGFFTEQESTLLIRAISEASDDAWMLEIGSYKGRSTLFALSALRPKQHWVIVDAFRTAAKYSGHSFFHLLDTLDQQNVSILPMTLAEASRHLSPRKFEIVFIDGDHSLFGVAQDLAIGITLAGVGGTILCHDVTDLFPAVVLVLGALEDAGVLSARESAGSLVRYEIISCPGWLCDPSLAK